MQRTTSIEIKLEGTVPFELSSLTENNEDKIFQLAQNGYTCAVHLPPLQMEYQVRVPAFGKSHILVRTQDSVESMVVYGVECMEGVQMSCDQIANRVQEIFGIDVSENLTACFTWENANDTSNGETMYSCGTLFTSGQPCSTSSSSTTPPDTHPTSQRPDCLPLTMSTLPTTLVTPRPVATPNTMLPNGAVVAGNGSFNIRGDPCKEAFDDSVPAYTEEGAPMHREGMVKVPTLIQHVLGPAQKVQGGNAGELTNPLGVVALDTPEKNTTFQEHIRPKVRITVLDNDDVSTSNESPIPQCVEASSQESEQCLSSQPERGSSLVTSRFDKKLFGNQLVVGIGMGQPRRKVSVSSQEPILNKTAFSRQLSLPGEKLTRASLQHNSSDDCLERLEVRGQHNQSANNSDLQLDLIEQPEPNEKADHTPATPTKPLAVERQDSVASPELVMIKNNSRVPFHNDEQQAVSNEPQNIAKDEQQEQVKPEGSSSLSDCDESIEVTTDSSLTTPTTSATEEENKPPAPTIQEGKPPVPTTEEDKPPVLTTQEGKPPAPSTQEGKPTTQEGSLPAPTTEDGIRPAITTEANPPAPTTERDMNSISVLTTEEEDNIPAAMEQITDSPVLTKQFSSDLSQQAHLLEHAMNGYCQNQSVCQAMSGDSSEFAEAVEQMKSLIEQADMHNDQLLKIIVREHCRKCRDRECKVPHLMAGCKAPWMSYSTTEQTDSPQYTQTPSSNPSSQDERPLISFDKELANLSTSSDVQKFWSEQANAPPLTPAQPSDDFLDDDGQDDQTGRFTPKLPWHESGRPPPHLVPLGPSFVTSPTALKRRLPPDQQLAPSDCGSPVGSEGFEVPGLHIPGLQAPGLHAPGLQAPGPPMGQGQQYQESQQPAASYLHQATDKGNAELRPRERRLYQYIEPSRSGGGIRKMYGGTERKVKGTKAGEFPSYSSLPRRPGTIIYSLKENELVPGEVYPCPHNVHSERDRLGKGGNGTVVKFPLGGTEYALKQTTYRENELNIWSKLDHPNILPLLGVMLGEQQRDCFQFMPKMTADLRSMLFDQGDLVSLLQKHPEQWPLVRSNIVYILEEILHGLIYLESQNVQHSDLKANNVLILKRCACPDIVHCQCPKESKYQVKLADFDSLKKTVFKRSAAQFAKLCNDSLMNDMDRNKVKGTPAYRAPEQFLLASNCGDYKKVLQDGKVQHDLEGPWCDIWSLGIIILQTVLGSHSKGPYINEASMLASCKADKMQPRIEASVATIRLVQLQDLSSHAHPELKAFAKLARECLKIDCRTRPTARELLEILQAHTNC